jgi:DNA-binding CsgD family transcriptional regulator
MTQHWSSDDTAAEPESDRLAALTQKQRDVLDLLIQFKTSKEMSRILHISPHTVDQRVEAAKNKLGASSRAELALIYRALLGPVPSAEAPQAPAAISERVTYEESHVADPAVSVQFRSRVGPAIVPPSDPEPGNGVVPDIDEDEIRVVPELFDGRWGTFARLVAILGVTVLICVAFLGGLAIFVQVSSLVGVGHK